MEEGIPYATNDAESKVMPMPEAPTAPRAPAAPVPALRRLLPRTNPAQPVAEAQPSKETTKRAPPQGKYDLCNGRRVYDLLGKGSFGEVYFAIEEATGTEEVCKVVNTSTEVQVEVEFHKSLPMHPHIIQFKSMTESSLRTYIFMQYGGAMNLLQVMMQRKNRRFGDRTS